jgi:16S rRNA (guanine966-N2)-methyltransferase
VRIVAGSLRGRRFEAPEGKSTRPTTDKVREAVFNALWSMDVLDEARVTDMFAGSGALGFEALSRGASHCTFVESDRRAIAVIKSNIEHLGLESRSTVLHGDAMSRRDVLAASDIVLADPPYEFTDWQKLLTQVAEARQDHPTTVVVESDKPLAIIEGWEAIRSKRYGGTWVTFLQRLP